MKIKNKELPVPIIQGGMGVGVSLSSLAGNVAKCGGMGVISSVNAGYQEEDFDRNPREANLRALTYHIKKAKEISQGNGMVAVNIMTAVSDYENACKCAVEAGADAIISGAGLPLKLPEYTKGTDTLFAPIVSSGKAAALLCRNYSKKYDVVPDFIVLEGNHAGGHLGFKQEELLDGTALENDAILADVLDAIKPYEEQYQTTIPVFVAGGVFDGEDMAHFLSLGASGVQMATRFIATDECDAHVNFKKVIVNAKKEDIMIIKSPVGMPARAINSPLLKRLSVGEKFTAKICNGCLTGCLRGDKTPYCISRALIEAVKGNWEDGLFFCGDNAYRVNEIIPVKQLMETIEKEWRNSQ
ncbi:MAG: nitronate monooxygenase family protein [Thermoflexaceae bacterium]|nr:nitronate monooxygenase family protein [Thermoflexaceae bacterium]